MKRSHKISVCARAICNAAALSLIVVGLASNAYAIDFVPELDPASATSAVTLLAGGLLIVAARLRRR